MINRLQNKLTGIINKKVKHIYQVDWCGLQIWKKCFMGTQCIIFLLSV